MMRTLLLLAAATAGSLALAGPAAAQAPPGAVFTPCGARVVASGWDSISNGSGRFNHRVTLTATAMVHIRVAFSMPFVNVDNRLWAGADFTPGRSGVFVLGQGPNRPGAAALQAATTLTCATMVLD